MHNSSHRAVDIVIPVCNGYPYTRTLLEGVYRYTDLPFHLYVVDNASTDETADISKIYTRDITVVRNRENRGWAAGINQGVELGQQPDRRVHEQRRRGLSGLAGQPGRIPAEPSRDRRGRAIGVQAGDWQCVDRVRAKLVPQIPHFLTDDLHERNRILSHHFHQAGILVEGSTRIVLLCSAASGDQGRRSPGRMLGPRR